MTQRIGTPLQVLKFIQHGLDLDEADHASSFVNWWLDDNRPDDCTASSIGDWNDGFGQSFADFCAANPDD